MSESGRRKPETKDLLGASRDVLAKPVSQLVETGDVSTEVVHDELTGIRAKTEERVISLYKTRKQLSPEQAQQWLAEFKIRFDALPHLHKGIKFTDVEKSLKADPEAMAKLLTLDAKGHAINVFGEENGEFIFASAWGKYEQVGVGHRNITYDLKGQELAEKRRYDPSGNAVSIIAKIMCVKEDEAGNYLAAPKFHEQLRKAIVVDGCAWLKTDAATRETNEALRGDIFGSREDLVHSCGAEYSFRAELRVKKLDLRP